MSLWRVRLLVAGLAAALGDLPAWECVTKRPCSIQFSGDNVTAEDLILVSTSETCDTCFRTDAGVCPWLDGDSGVEDLTICQVGNTTTWRCQGVGKGDRVLCPPDYQMCAQMACGGGLDFCCDEITESRGLVPCQDRGGPRLCRYMSLQNLRATVNETHGFVEPGAHAVCRCSPADFAAGAAGQRLGTLHVVGPGAQHKQSCLSGASRCFAEATNAFGLSMVTSLFQVTPAATCADVADTPQSFAEKFRFQWNPDWSGAYLDVSLPGRKWLAEQYPGIYNLCWCQNDTEGACESLSDFNVSAGQFTWSGPFKKEVPLLATIGDVFELELSGVGIRSNSVLSIQKDCGGSEGPWVWVDAVQSSTKFLYNFGRVAEDRLPPGTYSACWCEPTPNSACSLAADQVTQVAEVYVRCPLGQFSPGGTGACQQCDFVWEEPNQARNDCSTRAANAGQIVGLCLCYLLGWVLLWYQMAYFVEPGCRRLSISGRKVHIADISSKPSENGDWTAFITTVQPHHFTARFGTFPIYFYQTGHYQLDRKPTPGKFLYRARSVGPNRLQLLDEQGNSVASADTSRGYFVLRYARCVVHTDLLRGIPVLLVASVLLLVSAPLLVLANLQSEPTFRTWGGTGVALSGCVFGCVVAWLLRYVREKPSPIHQSIQVFLRDLQRRNPNPVACKKGPDRALTAYQIFDLMQQFQQYIRDRNLYYIDSNIVQPLTSHVKLSLAELLGPSSVAWFVSHYWGTKFAYTCDALRRHAEHVTSGQKGTSWQTISYWICAFSNNQYQIAHELGTSHKESSFYLALHSPVVQGTCMILDEKALPLTRSWCLFELLQTVLLEKEREDFKGLQFCTNTGIVNFGQATTEVAITIGKRLAGLSLSEAEATCVEDQETIKSLVVEEMGSFDEMDKILDMKIKDALVICKKCTNEEFNRLFELIDNMHAECSNDSTAEAEKIMSL
ncbi:unnamed protein product [Symbiodinium natans]|uniref:SMB domain-containing protein n=1 Tax=Symbiodinium natans TaxID=878477 RepID=A0A812QYR8_9DINO|nr:unnamed protein product [Symbiodinium natans]